MTLRKHTVVFHELYTFRFDLRIDGQIFQSFDVQAFDLTTAILMFARRHWELSPYACSGALPIVAAPEQKISITISHLPKRAAAQNDSCTKA